MPLQTPRGREEALVGKSIQLTDLRKTQVDIIRDHIWTFTFIFQLLVWLLLNARLKMMLLQSSLAGTYICWPVL